MKKINLLICLSLACGAVVLTALESGVSSPAWSPHSLSPVRTFARVSAPGDVDEGQYRGYDGFLSAKFSESQPWGVPGHDAPPQPFRRNPYGLAISEDETKLYITAPGNEAEPGNSVLVIGTENGEVAEIQVGSRPFGIARSPGGLYVVVTNQFSNYLSVIDTRSDQEVLRIPTFYYAQKIAFVADRHWMLVTNRALDSLDVYSFEEDPLRSEFLFRTSLTVENRPFKLDDDPGYGLGGEHQILVGPAPGFSNTEMSTPRELVRTMTNVNPRDIAVIGHHAYIANVGGLGVSVVDLDEKRQVASIDLNAPALDVIAAPPYVFVSTLGRFVQGFDDVHNEIAVIDTRHDPLSLRMRFTSAPHPPYGPALGPGRGDLVPPNGAAPYLSAFGVANFSNHPKDRSVFLRILDGVQTNPDNLPMIVQGALPDQMILLKDRLVVAGSASDEIELFTIDPSGDVPQEILIPSARAFTNATQTAFPTTIDRRALLDNGDYLLGEHEPDYFRGRMPQEMAYAENSGRLYIVNSLGQSVSVFQIAENGWPAFERFIDLTVNGMPVFPATLAEVGEDFYTTSRVSLNRDISCLSCHPDLSTDSKIWHVGSTPGRSTRVTLTNRNLRDTGPYYRSGIRRNLEAFRGTFRVMAPEGPFGFFEIPAPFDANGDGTLNDRDRGRTVADVNRNRMFALERTGVNFEKTSAAIAAFLESEPRLLPNPFLTPDGELSKNVPLAPNDSGQWALGDAAEGRNIFISAGCPTCHPQPVYTTNEVLSLENGGLYDMDHDGIPDGVTLSVERTLFDRAPTPWEQYRRRLPRERLPFASIDTDPRLHFANTPNTFTPPEAMATPRSPFSGRELVSWTADTRHINVPSLRGLWDIPVMLQHGRAVNLLDVQTTFNEIGRHGDRSLLGEFDLPRGDYDVRYRHLEAFLKSIE